MIKHRFLKFVSFCVFVGMASVSLADVVGALSVKEPEAREKKAADKAVEIAKAQLNEGRVELVARRGLEFAVRAAMKLLRKEGFDSYASRKEGEWNRSFSLYSDNGLGMLDLGDHAPLSEWVADFYDGITARVDEKWLKLFSIYDLKIFNFGIPVAVHPSANPATGADWGIEEYSLHFVPVSAAAIYWISSQACSLSVPFPFSLGCGVAARLPRYGMEHLIAPKLSDKIYNRFN